MKLQEQEPVILNREQSREEFRAKDLSFSRFLQLQKKYFGAWGTEQANINLPPLPPASKIPVEQKKQQVEQPKPQKKKRKDEFVINQRFLKKESSNVLNQHSNKNFRKYNDKYFEYIEALRENDFSVFDRIEYQTLVNQSSNNSKSKFEQIKQQSQIKSKRPKKKQMYMPTVVSTIKKASDKNEDSDKAAKKELNTQRIEMKIKKLKQKIRQLQRQINQDDISQKQSKKLNKEKNYVYGHKKYLEELLRRRKQKQMEEAKRAHLDNLEKTIKVNITTSNKPQTQYQKYIKEKNEKQARKEQLLLQEELRAQRQRQFEQKIKNSRNPLHALSQMQDEMVRNGNKLLQNLMVKAGLRDNRKNKNKNKNKKRQQPEKQQQQQTQQTQLQKQKEKEKQKQKQRQLKAQKTDNKDKYNKKPKSERKNRQRKEQISEQQNEEEQEESINSGSSVPKWKRELMRLTGYDPSSQKYRDRDREEIHQSGFSRIEKQDKFSRRMARRQQKQAEAEGQVQDI